MNFKFVKQKIVMSVVVGAICFCTRTITSEATEIEYPPTIVTQNWAIVQATALNLRMGPGTEYEIKDTVLYDTELLMIGSTINGWQAVQFGDNICYVSAQYIIEETRYLYLENKEVIVEETPSTEVQMEVESSETTNEIEEVVTTRIITGDEVVEYAMQFIGNPYVWGGTDLMNGADCSGFVQSIYSEFEIEIPRTSSEQRSAGIEISYEEIELGDIICYDGHVGIYAGDGQIVNAINSEKGIGMTSATYANIISIRRVL
ncbi:MAG: C40 family peptidase [Eubacteriales bacterium]